MIEILWIGRGGQGAFTAAKLLGAAYSLKGNEHYALVFPSFGPERRGAPVKAFSKLDVHPILDRSQTEKADYIVVLDETLYSEALKDSLKPNGKIIISSKHITGESIVPYNGQLLASQFHLPTVNTIMLGVVAGISQLMSLENLSQAIDGYMPEKIRSKNKEAVTKVLREVRA